MSCNTGEQLSDTHTAAAPLRHPVPALRLGRRQWCVSLELTVVQRGCSPQIGDKMLITTRHSGARCLILLFSYRQETVGYFQIDEFID